MTQCAFDQGPQVKRHGRATVRHPALEGQELALGDIEAVTGEGIKEGNVTKMAQLVAWPQLLGMPWILMADFNVTQSTATSCRRRMR